MTVWVGKRDPFFPPQGCWGPHQLGFTPSDLALLFRDHSGSKKVGISELPWTVCVCVCVCVCRNSGGVRKSPALWPFLVLFIDLPDGRIQEILSWLRKARASLSLDFRGYRWLSGKSACPWWLYGGWWLSLPMQETQFPSLGQEDPLEEEWQPTPVSLPGEPHGQRSLVDYKSTGSQRAGHDLATQ